MLHCPLPYLDCSDSIVRRFEFVYSPVAALFDNNALVKPECILGEQ